MLVFFAKADFLIIGARKETGDLAAKEEDDALDEELVESGKEVPENINEELSLENVDEREVPDQTDEGIEADEGPAGEQLKNQLEDEVAECEETGMETVEESENRYSDADSEDADASEDPGVTTVASKLH